MVQRVEGGLDVLNNFFFAQPTEQDVCMFQESHQNILQRMMAPIAEPLTNFYHSVMDQIQTIDYSRLRNFARSVERKVFSFWESDEVIIPLNSLADLQFPPHNMIRWLMANPVVREKYHKKEVAGYDDKYVDLDPHERGHWHKDYQMVMDGMETVDDEGETWYTSYERLEGDTSLDELTLSERLDIITSWDATNYYLSQMGEDPTSQFAGML